MQNMIRTFEQKTIKYIKLKSKLKMIEKLNIKKFTSMEKNGNLVLQRERQRISQAKKEA